MNRTAKTILKVQRGIDFLDWQFIADREDEENNEDELRLMTVGMWVVTSLTRRFERHYTVPPVLTILNRFTVAKLNSILGT
jgi:hypothetical protein